jgi:threonine dehydrogenase-like Zn-dependent dehydrogenase
VRAMTHRGPYEVRVQERERPAIEHPNDAIVRVAGSAVLRADAPRLLAGLLSRAPPLVVLA